MIPSFLDKSQLPHKPGVYQFKDTKGKILYVGKAIDLYHRVASYFNKDVTLKTAALVEKISSVETIIVESELEALILEANLIKKYLPIFNIRLTDDKDYLYIAITKEDFPKVITARKQDLKEVKKYWGTFPSSRIVRDTLKQLRRVFPWCSNPPKLTMQPPRLQVKYRAGFLDSYYTAEGSGTIAKTRFRPCFYYHLHLCPGACAGVISKEDYSKIINKFSKFMDGKKGELVDGLAIEMMQASKSQKFELAAKIKKEIVGIEYMTQANRVHAYLENPNFLEDENNLAIAQLQKDLNLEKLPERIEGYDISNISGIDATGSLVVLTHGEIDKSQYRKFKIHIAGKPNDVGMHKEMMKRRLKHKEWPLPDLIIIDGGRGQVRGVSAVISESVSQKIPIFGLAKKQEWLYPPQGEIIKLSKRALSLKLLQKLRDEAHRFAIGYHRHLHLRSSLQTKDSD